MDCAAVEMNQGQSSQKQPIAAEVDSCSSSGPASDDLNYDDYPLYRKTSIRLLHLDGASDLKLPLVGSFFSIDLEYDSNCPFAALSYCWGCSDRTAIVIIDGRVLKITKQLRNALRRVRAQGCPMLWADQICINQDDNVEKSRQVPLMAGIYSNAYQTFGYLGETEDDGQRLVASFLSQVVGLELTSKPWNITSMAKRGKLRDYFTSALNNFLSTIQFDTHKQGQHIYAEDLITAMEHIACQPFFSRVWILQEMILAGSDRITLLLGAQPLLWDSVTWLCHLAFLQGFHPEIHLSKSCLRFLLKSVRPRKAGDEPSRMSGLTAFKHGSNFQCSDPRDKFYALRALVTDRTKLPAVDYTKSVRDVFIEHSCYIFSQVEQTYVIGNWFVFQTSSLYEYSQAPGWCLGRSQEAKNTSLFLNFGHGHQGEGACGPHQMTFAVPDAERGILRLSGVVFDSVDEMKFQGRTEIFQASSADPWLINNLEALADYFIRSRVFTEAEAYIVALTRMRDLLDENFSRMASSVRIYKEWRDAYAHGPCLPLVELETINGYDPDWRNKVIDALETPSSALQRSIQETLKRLRFFITKKGFCGIAFDDTAPGDAVAVISGLQPPIVMRPEGNAYRFLWPAYVSGIMQGEVFTQHGLKPTDLDLC